MERKITREIWREEKSDRKVEDLVRDIRREEVPPHLLELARTLQAALDAREEDEG